MRLEAPVPILRSFDEARTRAFWIDWLGFGVEWEHRFEPDLPLYMQIRHGNCVIQLSEHYGDATPGSAIRIQVEDVDAFHAALAANRVSFARPGLQDQPWGAREMAVSDPSGNRIVIWSAATG